MEINMQDVAIVGFILDTLGKLLVAYTSIMVHHRFRHEHRVDEEVFMSMKKEQTFGMIGILLILVGASMELWAMLSLR